jgi:hypothetical protein
MNTEQRRILDSKPIGRIRRFAALLNWHGLQLHSHVFTSAEMAKWNFPPPGLLIFFMTPDLKFNLQINESPIGQAATYQATVKANRYGIVHVGWHYFTLFDDDEDLRREAERLRPWLDRNLFKSKTWRREYEAQHAEMVSNSRKKRRGRTRKRA